MNASIRYVFERHQTASTSDWPILSSSKSDDPVLEGSDVKEPKEAELEDVDGRLGGHVPSAASFVQIQVEAYMLTLVRG